MSSKCSKENFTFCHYLSNLPEDRIVKKAFKCQNQLKDFNNLWLGEIFKQAEKFGLQEMENWTKQNVKGKVYEFWLKKVQTEVRDRQSLRFMKDFVIPQKEWKHLALL